MRRRDHSRRPRPSPPGGPRRAALCRAASLGAQIMKFVFPLAAGLLLAAPAFAAEEYPSGSPLVLFDRAATNDTGSENIPLADGAAAQTTRLYLRAANAAEAMPETVNSRSVALGTWHNSIGLLTER